MSQIFVKSRAQSRWTEEHAVCIITVYNIYTILLAACPIKQEQQLITTRDGTATYNLYGVYDSYLEQI